MRDDGLSADRGQNKLRLNAWTGNQMRSYVTDSATTRQGHGRFELIAQYPKRMRHASWQPPPTARLRLCRRRCFRLCDRGLDTQRRQLSRLSAGGGICRLR